MKAFLPAAIALLLAAPAFAAPAAPEDKATAITNAQAIMKASETPCTVTDVGATYVGAYEVACREGFGYFVIGGSATTKGDVKACALLAELPNEAGKLDVACTLPANRDPYAIIKTIFSKQRVTDCDVVARRYVGDTANSSLYEVVCAQNKGLMLQAFRDGTLTNANTCGGAPLVSRGQPCELTAMGLERAKAEESKRQAMLDAAFAAFDRPPPPRAAPGAPASAPAGS